MSDDNESAVNMAMEQIKNVVFSSNCQAPQSMQFVFEFSSPTVAGLVEQKCIQLGMGFKNVGDPKRPLAAQIVMEDITRTQFLIAKQCARKKAQYRKAKKEIDFVCYGEDWKAPEKLENEKYTIRQRIYKHTYQANEV